MKWHKATGFQSFQMLSTVRNKFIYIYILYKMHAYVRVIHTKASQNKTCTFTVGISEPIHWL